MLSFLYVAAGPIEQFEIKRWMHIDAGGMDLSFTNSSAYMILAVVLILALFGYAASKGQMVAEPACSLWAKSDTASLQTWFAALRAKKG